MTPSFFKKGDDHSSAFVSKAEETSGTRLSNEETKRWLGINTEKSWYEELATPSFGNRLKIHIYKTCLLYTSPSPRDATLSRMPSSA